MAEVYVEGKRLDVFEGFKFSFNYSIADIRHPEKRSTEYSKTIRCPGTPNNDSIFGQIYDLNISNTFDSNAANIEVNFNPNKKAEAIVIADGLPIMKGSIQLRKIKRKYTDYLYEVSFLGQLIDIFGEIGDKELNGVDDDGNPFIDFSDLDHDYTRANQETSWTAGYGSGYVYPMVDYGTNMTYNALGQRVYHVEDLRPAVYLKDIVDRIFSFAGFSYTSSFLSSAFFERLVVPWTNEGFLISDEDRKDYEMVAQPDSERLIFTPADVGQLVYRCQFDDVVDPSNLYDPVNEVFTTLYGGTYTIDAALAFRMVRITTDASMIAGTQFILNINSDIGILAAAQINQAFPGNPSGTTINNTGIDSITATDVYLPANTNVWVEMDFSNGIDFIAQGFMCTHIETYQRTECFFQTKITDNITDGQNLPMNSFVPEVSMSDILLSLFNMFNLYVVPDPNQENNLLIETRDDFYEGGEVKDWSKKLDYSKEVALEPLAMLTANEYLYTYSEDSDYYNERYQDRYGRTYGSARIEVDNDFLNSTKEVSVVFGATPLVNDGLSNRIIPKVYDSDMEDGISPTDIGIRVLYYAGLLDSNPNWRHDSDLSGNAANSSYPYAGHLTHPLAPSQDINFGVPQELYYQSNGYTGALLYTNDNLFNRYHRRGLLEATNKDSKLMTAYFTLTPIDIHRLDFRDQILIDNSYWRLNRVMNYNPFDNDLTKVELIKVITKEPLKSETFGVGTGGVISGGSGVEKRPRLEKSQSRRNSFPPKNGKVRGSGNIIGEGSVDFMVKGNDNRVGTGSQNVTIIGDNNTVIPSLRNVTILNSSGVTATRSNQTFVNNREQESSEVLEGGEDEVRALDGGTNIFTVDGGEDTVQAQFSESSIYIIDGN